MLGVRVLRSMFQLGGLLGAKVLRLGCWVWSFRLGFRV